MLAKNDELDARLFNKHAAVTMFLQLVIDASGLLILGRIHGEKRSECDLLVLVYYYREK